jgi:hypothetical protein
VFERIPSCNRTLAEVRDRCTTCGGKAQIPCPASVRVPSCDTGLIEDFARGQCITLTNPADKFRAKAEAEARAIAPLIAEIWLGFGPLARQENLRTLEAVIRANNMLDFQRRVESQRRIATTYALLARYGYNTMTVGVSGGGSLGYGRFKEKGLSFDVTKRAPAYVYTSDFRSGGIQASFGVDLTVSAFFDRNGCIEGKAVGIGGGFDVGTGHGVVMWFDFQNERFLGFTTNSGLASVGGGGFAGEGITRVQARC